MHERPVPGAQVKPLDLPGLAAVRASNPPTTYTASPTTAAATSVRDSGAGASAFQRRLEALATAAEHGLAG